MSTTSLLPTSSSVPRETVAPVLTREPLGLSHLSLNDRIQTDVVKGWLWNTSQSRLRLELGGRSVTVAIRELTPSEFRLGDPEPSLSYFTTLFWKAMKIQYRDDTGIFRSKWILVNLNSYNKRLSETSVSLDSIPSGLERRLDLTPENVWRKAEKAVFPLGLTPEHGPRVYDLLMRFYERELEYRLTDVTLTEGQITLYSRGGRFLICFQDKIFDLDKEAPIFTFTSDGRSMARKSWNSEEQLGNIHRYLNRHYDELVSRYQRASAGRAARTPFILPKAETGLPRTLFFYSPSQIYLLENMSIRSDEDGVVTGDKLVAFGGFKKVKTAIDLLSGKEMILSSMWTCPRHVYDERRREFVQVRGDTVEMLAHEQKARAPLIGVSHVIQTVASHTFRSRKGGVKVWSIENRYEGDLCSAIQINPRTGKPDIDLTFKEKKSVAGQIIIGLKNIHRAGFVHRDIKPENILIRREMKSGRRKIRAVVSDLGLAVNETDMAGRSGFAGTRGYLAPEYIRASGNPLTLINATKDVIDWYATGLTLHMLFCGPSAFSDTGELVFTEEFRTANPQLHQLIQAMTSANPNDRSWSRLERLIIEALR